MLRTNFANSLTPGDSRLCADSRQPIPTIHSLGVDFFPCSRRCGRIRRGPGTNPVLEFAPRLPLAISPCFSTGGTSGEAAPPPPPLGLDRRDAGHGRRAPASPSSTMSRRSAISGRWSAPRAISTGSSTMSRSGPASSSTPSSTRRSAASSSASAASASIHAVSGARSGDRRAGGGERRAGQGPRRAASTRSTPLISPGSTRSSSPSPMTTASARRIGRRPTSSSPACRAPRRRRPASISPIAATRSPTCRSSPNRRRRRRLFGLKHPMIVGLTTNIERLIQIRRNRLLVAQPGARDRLCRRRGGQCRARLRPADVRRQWLAGDRRHPPLDRGDRARDRQAVHRADGEGGADEAAARLAERDAAAHARGGGRAVRDGAGARSTRRRPRPA